MTFPPSNSGTFNQPSSEHGYHTPVALEHFVQQLARPMSYRSRAPAVGPQEANETCPFLRESSERLRRFGRWVTGRASQSWGIALDH
jgi:hypothetical protein